MSRCSTKLSALSQIEQKLLSQKKSLIEKRKYEIGCLAERQQLLTLADDVWLGIFIEVAEALQSNTIRINEWKNKGALFFREKKCNRRTIEKNQRTTLQNSITN